MKVVSLLVAQVLAVITANVAFVWGIIEFILYLAKDKEFNWWSVWAFVISAVIAIAITIIAAVAKVKQRNRAWDDMKQRRTTGKRSRFQERLEEMQRQRANA
jgi:phosphotransferase system  glucose/maltose/N-acetylglucosamine-specific IIC component